MCERGDKPNTVLHFSCIHEAQISYAQLLRSIGYRVLSPSDGFETIEVATREPVDAVVLDLHHSRVEVMLIAREIKRRRPQLPVLVLVEAATPAIDFEESVDAVAARENDLELVGSLKKLLSPTGQRKSVA